jgi:hypothetical protein
MGPRPRAFTRRIGRNETFNHAGNALAAGRAGFWGLRLEVGANSRVLSPDAIDYDRARGLHDGPRMSHEKPSGLSALMSSRGHSLSRTRAIPPPFSFWPA